MNHIENHMFEEMKHLIDRSALIWLILMTSVSLLTGLLCLLGVLPHTALWSLLWLLPTAIVLCVVVHFYHKKGKNSCAKTTNFHDGLPRETNYGTTSAPNS